MLKKSARGVTFTFDEKSDEQIYLAGDFNNWNEKSHPLKKGKDKKWSITIKLPPGEHQFRYVKNNEWYNDHKADKYVRTVWDSDNSVVVVPESRKEKVAARR